MQFFVSLIFPDGILMIPEKSNRLLKGLRMR